MKREANRFFKFMHERESIRLKKEAGKPWPWTKDKILNTYSFTNIKREHDRTSQLLIQEFYKPNFNAPREIVLLNCAIARYFGTIDFMRAVGWQESFNPRRLKKIAGERMAAKETVWTGAYMIPAAGHAGPKEEIVVDIFFGELWKNRKIFIPRPFKWQPVVEALMQIEGFGGSGFMAKEVILDTRYTGFWPEPPEDRYDWTPVGPGGMRGAARIMGHTDKRKLTKDETVGVCLALLKQLPKEFKDLELHDIQWGLCEFDKMERVRLGQGRPRKTYKPKFQSRWPKEV